MRHPIMEENMDMDKHRPYLTRRLTATDLDKRQARARLHNHGQEILLQSKMDELKIDERRFAKRLQRDRQDVTDILQNIQVASARAGSGSGGSHHGNRTFRNGETLVGNGRKCVSQMSNPHGVSVENEPSSALGRNGRSCTTEKNRRNCVPQNSNEINKDSRESSSSKDTKLCGLNAKGTRGRSASISGAEVLPKIASTGVDQFSRNRLNPKRSGLTEGVRFQRRFSANDALADSLVRFNLYRASGAKLPPFKSAAKETLDQDSAGDSFDKEKEGKKDQCINPSTEFTRKSLEVAEDTPMTMDLDRKISSSNLSMTVQRVATDNFQNISIVTSRSTPSLSRSLPHSHHFLPTIPSMDDDDDNDKDDKVDDDDDENDGIDNVANKTESIKHDMMEASDSGGKCADDVEYKNENGCGGSNGGICAGKDNDSKDHHSRQENIDRDGAASHTSGNGVNGGGDGKGKTDKREKYIKKKRYEVLDPYVPDQELPLRLARQHSLSVKPATYRRLIDRRNSSPEVISTSLVSFSQRFSISRQNLSHGINYNSSTISLATSAGNRCWNSDDLELNSKIKSFLQRTDDFIQQQLPQIEQQETNDR